jgi:hypothetical protein
MGPRGEGSSKSGNDLPLCCACDRCGGWVRPAECRRGGGTSPNRACRIGAPEEIRTPDPQIRSLVWDIDFIVGVVEPGIIRESFQRGRWDFLILSTRHLTKVIRNGSVG